MHTESFEHRGVTHVGEFSDYDPEAIELWKQHIRKHAKPVDRMSPEDSLSAVRNARDPQPVEKPAVAPAQTAKRKR